MIDEYGDWWLKMLLSSIFSMEPIPTFARRKTDFIMEARKLNTGFSSQEEIVA